MTLIKTLKYRMALAALVMLTACSLIPITVKDRAVDVGYSSCKKPLAARLLLRDEINLELQAAAARESAKTGTKVEPIWWCGVRCPGDPPPSVAGCVQ